MIAEMRSTIRILTPLQILVLLALIPLAFVINHFLLRWWLLAVLIPPILLAYHYLPSLAKGWQVVMACLLAVIIVLFGLIIVKYTYSGIVTPPEWDVRWFWLQGSVAAKGENFYDPQNVNQLAQVFHPSKEFLSELYFWYPPPTMFLFVGMGWFGIQTAALLWYIFLIASLVADIYLLWRIFLYEEKILGLLLTTALVLALRAVTETLVYGQTNYLVLLAVLLFWQTRRKAVSGVWLGIGFLIKPLVAFLSFFSILRRQWRSIGVAVATLVVAALLTIVVFSPTTFFSYFTNSPTTNTPDHLYSEAHNQSLLGTILRLTSSDSTGASPLRNPPFIVIAAALLAVTLWLVYRHDVVSDELAICLLLVLSLLLYPSTGDHYSVLLIPSVFLVWSKRQRHVAAMLASAAFIALIYVLVNLWTDYVFVAQVVDWLLLAGIGVWAVVRHKTVVEPPPIITQAAG
jgi:hypothetical protein